MNYMPGRMPPPNINPNMQYYGPVPVRQPQIINPRVYNTVMPQQQHFVPQPVFYPQQYGHSPTRTNRGAPFVNPFVGQQQVMNQYGLPPIQTQHNTMRPIPNKSSPIKKSNGPSFNASEPMDYKKVYSNAPSNNMNHSQGNQTSHSSTFALASNNMLRRSDVGLYSPGSTTPSQNNLLRPSLSTQFQQNSTHGNQLISVNSQNPITPNRNQRDRNNEQLRDSLVRSGITTLDNPNGRHRPGMSYNITATIIPLRNGQPITTSPTRASSWTEDGHGSLSNRNRHNTVNNNNQWISLLNTNDNDYEDNHATPGGLRIRPAMVQVTFTDPNLTNMTLTNLRSNFNNDEMFGEELMRINDLMNFMVGTPDNQTNWVATFIEQFFTQLNDLPKEAKVLTDDAIANLPTITFKAAKKPKAKAKKAHDETLNSENLCAICLIDYEDGDTLTVLSCNHNFHNDCIGAWLKKKAECPTCRTVVE